MQTTADNIELLSNAPIQAESLLHSLEQAVEALATTWMLIKQNSCVLNEKGPFPL